MSEVPRIGLTPLQEPILTALEPSIMYGPEAMTSRPYAPGFPSKHLPTSGGIGPAAESAMRLRKSPAGRVSLNVIVFAFGVTMPEIDVALPLR